MPQNISLRLLPAEAANNTTVKEYIASAASVNINSVNGFYILKQSVDARGKQAYVNLTVNAFVNEAFIQRSVVGTSLKNVQNAKQKVIIVGAGPAGLFAALQLIELNIKPIIIERGKDVRARRRDLAALNKEGI